MRSFFLESQPSKVGSLRLPEMWTLRCCRVWVVTRDYRLVLDSKKTFFHDENQVRLVKQSALPAQPSPKVQNRETVRADLQRELGPIDENLSSFASRFACLGNLLAVLKRTGCNIRITLYRDRALYKPLKQRLQNIRKKTPETPVPSVLRPQTLTVSLLPSHQVLCLLGDRTCRTGKRKGEDRKRREKGED